MATSLLILLSLATLQGGPVPKVGYDDLLSRARGGSTEYPKVDATVAVWAVGDTVRVNPVTNRLFEHRDAKAGYRTKSRIWDAEAGRIRIRGARNEFTAFQVVVESENPAKGFKVRFDSLRRLGLIHKIIARLFQWLRRHNGDNDGACGGSRKDNRERRGENCDGVIRVHNLLRRALKHIDIGLESDGKVAGEVCS